MANKFQFQISKPISHLPIYKWNCFWHFKAFITCPFSMVIIIMAFWAMNWENVISNPDFTVIWLQVRCTYSRSFNLHPDFWKSRSIWNRRKISSSANHDFFQVWHLETSKPWFSEIRARCRLNGWVIVMQCQIVINYLCSWLVTLLTPQLLNVSFFTDLLCQNISLAQRKMNGK